MKFLRVLCVLALALCVTASVYAETQSVKVSGDLTIRGIARADYDYRGSIQEKQVVGGVDERNNTGSCANQSWFMSNTEVQIDADLTDNVQTVIRILNQRDWNVTNKNVQQGTSLAWNGYGGYSNDVNEFNVNLDLAYVTLKDFIYSPLTLTIGRQDLWFGKGFIIGLNQQNPNSLLAAAGLGSNQTAVRGLNAPEYTALNSFDAFKAVLDYDPWTITGIYSNIENNAIQSNDGIDLWGINVGYKFDVYKAEAEGYWFYKKDRQVQGWNNIVDTSNDVHTLGLRGSADPIDVLSLYAEGAYQCGQYLGTRNQQNERSRSAYALDFGGELRYWTDKFAWKPKVGVEYVLYSGQKDLSNPDLATGAYGGWNPMFRGKFDSAIREFVGRYYATRDYPTRTNTTKSSEDASFTNQHQVIFRGNIRPVESLLLEANYNLFWTYEDYWYTIPDVTFTENNLYRGGLIGQEVDLQATWDYTEDVSFGVLGAFFIPSKDIYKTADKTATDIVGTVKVSF